MPPLLIDPVIAELQRLANTSDWEKLATKSAHESAVRVFAECPPPSHNLSGEAAADYLQTYIPLVKKDILAQHNGYGSVRWLWYLRRAPEVFFEGAYRTTLGYDHLLAEILSSYFTGEDDSKSRERVSFRVDASTFRHIARYVGRVKLLSQLHILFRRVGKGATLDTSRPIFTAHTSDAVERAIQDYDTRHDRSHEFVGSGLGLVSIDPNFHQSLGDKPATEPTAILSMGCTPSLPVQVPYPDGSNSISIVTVNARHILKELNLKRILSPFGSNNINPGYLTEIAPLVQLLMLMPRIAVQVPWTLSSVTQLGYVFVGEDRLSEIVEHNLPEIVQILAQLTTDFLWPTNYTDWRDSLLAIPASTWPLQGGNVLRRFKDNFLIDITGATHAFLNRLELTRSPLLGNLRAQEFEMQCQELIDNTSWKPQSELRNLRGRPLRREGKHWTDIDAIGSKDHTLLAISCKSIIYDRDYDQGVYKVIRNAQTTIDHAVLHWEGVVSELIEQPRGDNFDFSRYSKIIGIVCTPFAVYSSEERTLASVAPGLRASSSILEIKDWLADQ